MVFIYYDCCKEKLLSHRYYISRCFFPNYLIYKKKNDGYVRHQILNSPFLHVSYDRRLRKVNEVILYGIFQRMHTIKVYIYI